MEIKGSFRTIKSITENTNLWQQSGGNITKAKDFKNCINIPLINGDEETPVLKYIPPPELHLLLGVVQKLFDCLELENTNVATEWIKKAGLKLDHYGKYNANNARQLLKKLDILKTISPGINILQCFLHSIKSFRVVLVKH
ncbi:uncharacterized protein LOC115891445 [Sitophilus oryzae]|uniref:Uncharacterized protein LOC115891445 n=1 Tax=Sitophilus oryzae TaxID=7048 RepID=A0A6J2YWV6_SITOR|nr:uncharacterized protein LOC115891445 [Sitophilus oryzae]